MFTPEQQKLIDKLSNIQKVDADLDHLLSDIKISLSELKKVQSDINTVIAEKSKGFPWLADRIAEYFELRDFTIAEYLEKKFRPAQATADRVKELAKEKRIVKKEFLVARNFINYYESLFPWLKEYVGDDFDDLIKQIEKDDNRIDLDEDPVFQFIPKAEYDKRSESERNQMALDRYFASRKHSWQIGRDYERYIGYLYELSKFDVSYQGIDQGLADLGRDLICKKNDVVEIVQCKYWSQHKTIHEKHINQLFGTTVKYYLDFIAKEKVSHQMELFPELLKQGRIKATFITSTKLSETATQFAETLGIEVKQDLPMIRYPVIKCNLAPNGNKIYHLPFDHQYDITKIIKKGEFYVTTVAEAEKLGFRRAWKWHGSINSK
jgi:hypothetical protein